MRSTALSSLTRRLVLTAGAVCVAGLLAACSKTDTPAVATAASAPPAPAAAKVYVVGTDAVYAPFESQNDKGEIVGFDIDMLQAVADKAGIR